MPILPLQFFFIASFLLSTNLASGSENTLVSKRIVGGEVILDKPPTTTITESDIMSQWPWVVALSHRGSLICGATLIDNEWLLTAAHCVYDTSTGRVDTNLIIDASFLQSDLSQTSTQNFHRGITQIIMHPDYDYDLNYNDLALLKLDSTVNHIQPVQLPGSSYDEFTIKAGVMSTVLGWGITQDTLDSNEVLHKIEVPIVEQKACVDTYANYSPFWPIPIKDTMLCAGYIEGGKDACNGDSGGPLAYFSNTLQNWVQTGIVSFGIGCAEPGTYGGYTRISKFTAPHQLINETICEDIPETPVMDITIINLNVSIKFSTQQQDKLFRLYYAPYPEMSPIHYIDIIGDEFNITLTKGESYFIAAQTRNGNCISPFTTIETVIL